MKKRYPQGGYHNCQVVVLLMGTILHYSPGFIFIGSVRNERGADVEDTVQRGSRMLLQKAKILSLLAERKPRIA